MFLLRLLIVGDTGVGKTSLLLRFNEGTFMPQFSKTTIGVDYKAKEIAIDNEIVKLQIWDTAGQERFRSMTSAFYNKAQGVVLTFDVSQRGSFNSLDTWIKDINQYSPPGIIILLCANKIDLPAEKWQIRREEYLSYAQQHGLVIFESSASSGDNVCEIFLDLGRKILENQKEGLTKVAIQPEDKDEGLVLFDIPQSQRGKKRSCC